MKYRYKAANFFLGHYLLLASLLKLSISAHGHAPLPLIVITYSLTAYEFICLVFYQFGVSLVIEGNRLTKYYCIFKRSITIDIATTLSIRPFLGFLRSRLILRQNGKSISIWDLYNEPLCVIKSNLDLIVGRDCQKSCVNGKT